MVPIFVLFCCCEKLLVNIFCKIVIFILSLFQIYICVKETISRSKGHHTAKENDLIKLFFVLLVFH